MYRTAFDLKNVLHKCQIDHKIYSWYFRMYRGMIATKINV